MSLTLRSPEAGDADGLGRVHVRAWRAAYSGGLMPEDYLSSLSETERASMWRSSLENPPLPRATRLVATIDDEVIGFALVGPAANDENTKVGELYAINVDPDHWDNGVGAALINQAIAALQSNGFESAVLWVHPNNERARRFYTARGWIDDKIERRQDVLGVEVPEARLSLTWAPEPPAGTGQSSSLPPSNA